MIIHNNIRQTHATKFNQTLIIFPDLLKNIQFKNTSVFKNRSARLNLNRFKKNPRPKIAT